MSYLQRMEKRHPGLRSFLTVLLSAAMVLNSVPTQAFAEVVSEPQAVEIESPEGEPESTPVEAEPTEGEKPTDEGEHAAAGEQAGEAIAEDGMADEAISEEDLDETVPEEELDEALLVDEAEGAAATDVEAAQEKTVYEHETDALKVTATLENAEAIPDDAQFVVTEVTPEVEGYSYDAYMEALNKDAESEHAYTADNTILYDVAFLVERDGALVEVQPSEGSIKVEFQFKQGQLTNNLNIEDAASAEIIHLPIVDEAMAETTAAVTDASAEDIVIEKADAAIVPEEELAVFETDSLSVWAFTGNPSGEIEIGNPQPSTFEDASNELYKLKGDFAGMANVGIIAFDTLTLNQHCNGNFATNNLIAPIGQAFGTNDLTEGEVFYIGNSISYREGVNGPTANLSPKSLVVFGSGINIEGVTSSDGTEDNAWKFNLAGKTWQVNGVKPSDERFKQEAEGSKYIDLSTWKTKTEDLSAKFAGYPTTQVTRIVDGSYLRYIERSNTAIATLNIDATQLDRPFAIEDQKADESHVLIINVDAKGAEVVNFPGIKWVKPGSSEAQPGTTGEVTEWTKGNVIINVVDSTKDGGKFTGLVNINDQTTAMVLVPDGSVNAKFNVNGQIIANKVEISGSGEFHRDSFTFSNTITGKGGLRAAKALNGSRDLSKEFQFKLTSLNGAPMPSEAEGDTTMIASSEADGMVYFGYLNFEAPGSYLYEMEEVIPEGTTDVDGKPYKDGIVYDTTKYKVQVNADYNEEGTSIAIIGYEIYDGNTGERLGVLDYDAGKTGVVEFQNAEANGKAEVSVTKSVKDADWDDETFTFVLTGVSKTDRNGQSTWQNYYQLPGAKDGYGGYRYESGMSKKISVSASNPTAFIGGYSFNDNDVPVKYEFTLAEEIPGDAKNDSGVSYENASAEEKAAGGFVKDGIEYDSTVHTVVVEAKKVENKVLATTTYDGKSSLTITNKGEAEDTGSIEITKTIKGDVTAEEAEGALTFVIETPDHKYLKADGTTADTAEQATLTLADFVKGEGGTYTLTIEGVASGEGYTVTETTTGPEGKPVTVTHKVGEGDVAQGAEAEFDVSTGETARVAFEDDYPEQVGSIEITKTIKGDVTAEEAEGALTFVIETPDHKYLKADGTTADTAEQATLTLADFVKGEGGTYTLTIEGVASGEGYTVTETTTGPEGKPVTVTHKVGEGDVAQGAEAEFDVSTGETARVAFEDDYPEQVGALTVTKTVEGVDKETTVDNDFQVTIKNPAGEYVNADGNLQKDEYKHTIKADGKLEFSNLPVGTYTVSETNDNLNIDGYIYESLKVEGAGNVTKDTPATVSITNSYAKTSVSISKVDVANGEELEGATIQVLDFEGNVVTEWTSTKEPHEVVGLKTDVAYTLHETVAPDGYMVAADTTFTIDETGKVTSSGTVTEDGVILVEDSLGTVKVSKVAIANGEEVAGAHLQVIDSAGAVVDEWTSTKEAHEVTGLKVGKTYTLRETIAPDGYTIAADTTFSIDAEGNVTSTGTVVDRILLVEDAYAEPAIEKYINKDVHQDLPAFDTPFTYDILAYVPADAEKVVITDTLAAGSGISFLDGNKTVVTVEDIGPNNDHTAHGTVEQAPGTVISDSKASIDGKTLTVTIPDATANRGHWVRVTYQVVLDNTVVSDEEAYIHNDDNVDTNKTVISPTYPTHDGVETTASYMVYVKDMATGELVVPENYALRANSITVTPPVETFKVQKKWVDANGNEVAWPKDATVTIELLGNGKPMDQISSEVAGQENAIEKMTVTLDAKNPTGTFAELPIYESVTYSVVETKVTGVDAGFSTVYSGDEANGFVVTNSFKEEKKQESTKKIPQTSDPTMALNFAAVGLAGLGSALVAGGVAARKRREED